MNLRDVMAARTLGEFTDENGTVWRLQRTPARVSAEIRAKCTGPRVVVDPTNPKLGFRDGERDAMREKRMKVAYALVEPTVDGADLDAKAETVTGLLTDIEVHRLWEHSLLLDDLDLARKVEEEAKN